MKAFNSIEDVLKMPAILHMEDPLQTNIENSHGRDKLFNISELQFKEDDGNLLVQMGENPEFFPMKTFLEDLTKLHYVGTAKQRLSAMVKTNEDLKFSLLPQPAEIHFLFIGTETPEKFNLVDLNFKNGVRSEKEINIRIESEIDTVLPMVLCFDWKSHFLTFREQSQLRAIIKERYPQHAKFI